MKKGLQKTEKIIDRLLKYGVLISTYCLIGSVLLQIFARFFLENTPSWTEEASRLFFVYAISFAAGLAMKSRYYVSLDIFFSKFPLKMRKMLIVMVPLATMVLFSVMAFYSIHFIALGHPESSPSMKISMSYAFLSLLIMSASISFYALLEVMDKIKRQAS